ncbi:MAG TPA: GTPase ObgE [Phycisphaerae bacterium]|nr:GTPase ObgE [Phycisphaerae bacterium]
MAQTPPATKAMFVDEADIVVTSGAGGDGCVSFRREKFVPKGGPDGGNGGNGGSVYLLADEQYNTLQHLAGRHHWKAARGGHGRGKNCHGHNGADLNVLMPPGTIIHDTDAGVTLKDLAQAGDSFCVAAGGRGGRGNEAFKSSTHQAPGESERGESGRSRRLHLELKLIADAGLIGKPNAGKSTVLSRMSAARPKVAAYPFTTRYPCLGIVELAGYRRFVMADIPGLIEGAHRGAGLGDEFLRHVERTKLLVHIVDICPLNGDPIEDYRAIRSELRQYSPALAVKDEIIVANKMDLTGARENLKRFAAAVDGRVLAISGVTGRGVEVLGREIWRRLHGEE